MKYFLVISSLLIGKGRSYLANPYLEESCVSS